MLVPVVDLRTYMDISLSNRQIDAAEMILEGLQSELEAYLGRPIEVDEYTEEHIVPASVYAMPETSFFYDSNISTSDQSIEFLVPGVHLPLRKSPVSKVSSVRIRSLSNDILLGETIKRTSTITNVSISGTNVVYTTPTAHKFTIGQYVTIDGMSPSVYNISAKQITDETTTTFTIANTFNASGAFVSGGSVSASGTGYVVHRWGLEVFGCLPNDQITVEYTAGLDGESIKMFKLMILRAATREVQNMHDDVVGVKDLNPRNVAVAETGFLERELLALKSYRRRRIS